jgi:hypothetical protein
MQKNQQSKCVDLRASCIGPRTKDSGVIAPGGKSASNISASVVEATVSGQKDEKSPRTTHDSTTGPFHT